MGELVLTRFRGHVTLIREGVHESGSRPELVRPINVEKAKLVELAFEKFDVHSFVDLGACWAVHGGYTFHALECREIERAVIVDGHVTSLTRERADKYPQVEIIDAPLGAANVVEKVGRVDSAIFFGILLHQASPDWDELLAACASNVRSTVIYNQNWTAHPHTIRFADLGLEEHLRCVHHEDDQELREWFAKHDESNDKQEELWRDVYYIWQWGITQNDLVNALWDRGFRVELMQSYGPFDIKTFPDIYLDGLICVRR